MLSFVWAAVVHEGLLAYTFIFVFVYLSIQLVECLPVPTSFFP